VARVDWKSPLVVIGLLLSALLAANAWYLSGVREEIAGYRLELIANAKETARLSADVRLLLGIEDKRAGGDPLKVTP
jgi:hypothetical protein